MPIFSDISSQSKQKIWPTIFFSKRYVRPYKLSRPWRYQTFKCHENSEIRSLPPTWDALIQHIHKAAYVFGYIWRTLHIPAITKEPPAYWPYFFIDSKIKFQWVSHDHCLISQNLNKTVFKTCRCRKACKKNCKFKKVEMMNCLPTYKCRAKCEES